MAVTEKQWQAKVLEWARLNGWLCYHTHDSRRSAPGFPDLALLRVPDFMLVELKTDSGRLTESQHVWLDKLAACSIETHVWRPNEWDEVRERLSR